MKKIAILLSLVVLVSSFGFSQARSGNIYGKVVDADGVPLPGVSVTLKSEFSADMIFITTEKGSFRFISLPPGTYSLKAELEGFSIVRRPNIEIELGSNVNLTVEMVPRAVEEEITVIAASPVIDKKRTSRALHLTIEELQVLPTARDPWVILELAPGVVMDRENVGGSESGQQSYFASGGTSRSTATWNLDGIDRSGQVSEGESGMYFDFDAFEEIQIQTAATDITSYTAGVQINIVTRRGKNRFSGDARAYYTSDSFQSTNTPEGYDIEASKVTSIGDYGAHIGGPLIKDKLWFWTGFGYQDIEILDIVGVTIAQQLPNFELKLNALLGKHRIEASFSFSNSLKQGRVAYGALDAWESRYDQTGPKPYYKIQDEITFSPNFFLSLKAFYGAYGFKLTPIGGVGGIAYSDDAMGGRWWGTYRMSDYDRGMYFYQISGNLFQEGLFGVDHDLKFGVEYKHSIGKQDRIYPSQRLRYRDYEAGRSRRAYIYGHRPYDYRMPRLGVFLQDTVSIGRFTILAGLRYDRHWGYTKSVTRPATSVDWAGEYNLPEVTTQARDSNVIWNVFSPRLGIIYDVTGDGKTLVKANFGIYGNRYDSSFLGDLAETYGYVYWSWDDLNGDELVQTGELGSARVRDSFLDVDPSEVTDPDMTSPKTLELTAGIEHELLPNFALGGTFIYRRNYNGWWDFYHIDDNGTLRLPRPDDYEIGGNIPAEYGGYAWWQLKSGLERMSTEYYTNRPDYYERYLGFEFSFKKRFAADSKWLVNGSFTYQDWRRFYPTENCYSEYDPTDHKPTELMDGQYAGIISGSSAAVQASMNPRWMAKLGFAYRLPYAINIGGTFIIRDGYILPKHYTDYDVDRAGIDDNPTVYIAKYGTHRLGTFSILNLRVDKTIRIKEVVDVALIVDLFNVLNSNTTLDEEYTVSAANAGAILKYLSPRIFRFGLRVSF